MENHNERPIVVMYESNGPPKYGFMDYSLSDKQSDKAFLYKISLMLSEITSPPSESISFTITQLNKECLVVLYRNAIADCLSLSK